jgi:hypothetical protein
MELPKCSKSLHFGAVVRSRTPVLESECKANITTGDNRWFMDLAGVDQISPKFGIVLPVSSSPIWPLRCSLPKLRALWRGLP